MTRSLSVITSLLCLAILGLSAQTVPGPNLTAPKFTSVPPIEDVELYYAFFQHHQTLINANESSKAANPGQSAALDQQMAVLLNIDAKDLPAAVANTQQVAQSQANLAARKAAGVVPTGPQALPITPAQQAAQYEF